mmetsp:Transcript_11072/g.27992  ORF Transcript_11072/g.27992 Transcript_11072/m.27992 type:complete len:462 (+) Transcript_11072:2-1387(+)
MNEPIHLREHDRSESHHHDQIGSKILYDSSASTFMTALHYHDTIFESCSKARTTWVALGLHFGILGIIFAQPDWHEPVCARGIPWHVLFILTSLLIFTSCLYQNIAFHRYSDLYEGVRNALRVVLQLVSMLKLTVKDRAVRRRALRFFCSAICLFFFRLSRVEPGRDVDSRVTEAELFELMKNGFLTRREAMYLLSYGGPPHWLMLNWSMSFVEKHTTILAFKQFQGELLRLNNHLEGLDTNMGMTFPFAYFQCTASLTFSLILLWAYGMACHRSMLATPIFVSLTVLFTGMRNISAAMANPFGNDKTDFPISKWLRSTIKLASCQLEALDPYEVDEMGDETHSSRKSLPLKPFSFKGFKPPSERVTAGAESSARALRAVVAPPPPPVRRPRTPGGAAMPMRRVSPPRKRYRWSITVRRRGRLELAVKCCGCRCIVPLGWGEAENDRAPRGQGYELVSTRS